MPRALVAVALVVGCFVGPVAAHEELALHSLTVLGSLPSALDGVEVRVVHLGAPAFAVDNPTDEVLIVRDDRGRPFLEIGPRGVRADVSSELFYASVVPGTHDHLEPEEARGPRWVTFSDEPRWTWFDPRLESNGGERWDVAFALGDEETTVSGGFEPLDGHGHFVGELDTPSVQGLDVRLVQGPVPALYVRNDRPEVLEVFGAAGEPFLRLGPRGVSANVMSPTYHSAGGLTIQRIPAWADATATPRWKHLSDEPVWAWLEYRAAVSTELQQRDALGATTRIVNGWSSPMALGGEPLDLQGRIRWVPPTGTMHVSHDPNDPSLPRVALFGVFAVALSTGAILLARRPRASAA